MNWFQALILGLIEGLTEYLPVSSTAHILLTQRALGIENDPASRAYAICIQAGAIIAVLGIFSRRVGQMLRGLVGHDPQGLRLALQLLVAFAPAAVSGVLLEKKIETYLFGLWPVVAAWFVGGLAILAVVYSPQARRFAAGEGRRIEDLTWAGAVAIGLMQCLGMWPGTSRSLVTILGGLLAGLTIEAALEFSFLLGLITLTAATGYKAMKDGSAILDKYTLDTILIGFAAATVSAVVAVGWMLRYLRQRGLALFGFYRIGLAVVVAALLWSGRLMP
jgi:undecaprenyl-diphosphatase